MAKSDSPHSRHLSEVQLIARLASRQVRIMTDQPGGDSPQVLRVDESLVCSISRGFRVKKSSCYAR